MRLCRRLASLKPELLLKLSMRHFTPLFSLFGIGTILCMNQSASPSTNFHQKLKPSCPFFRKNLLQRQTTGKHLYAGLRKEHRVRPPCSHATPCSPSPCRLPPRRAATAPGTSTVAGPVRVNCGASVPATVADGRTWDRDAPSVGGVAAGASYEDPSRSRPPCRT